VFAELTVTKTISLFEHFIWKLFRNTKQLNDAIFMQTIFFSEVYCCTTLFLSFLALKSCTEALIKVQVLTTLYFVEIPNSVRHN